MRSALSGFGLSGFGLSGFALNFGVFATAELQAGQGVKGGVPGALAGLLIGLLGCLAFLALAALGVQQRLLTGKFGLARGFLRLDTGEPQRFALFSFFLFAGFQFGRLNHWFRLKLGQLGLACFRLRREAVGEAGMSLIFHDPAGFVATGNADLFDMCKGPGAGGK